jgi:hypothetical protein
MSLQKISDDKFLLYFLRGCKFSIERTKEKLDFFNSVRAALPDWFGNWDNLADQMSILDAG